MQLKKDMELELQTFDLEDVERLSEPIFETCLSYLNSNLANTKLEKIDVKYNVVFLMMIEYLHMPIKMKRDIL